MRRALPIVFLLLPCVAAEAETAKTFEAHGFSWTLPSKDWRFNPVPPAESQGGIAAKVESTSASISAFVYTRPTEDLPLSERVDELVREGGDGMGEVAKSVTKDTTLSGVSGKVVIQEIQTQAGDTGHFRKYVIVSGGKFYQLQIRCWHGAHKASPDAVNGIRKGFRLLKGAGKPDEDESMDELGGGEGGGAHGSGGDSGVGGGGEGTEESSGGSGDGWPSGGPKKSGNTISIPEHNVEWTLPDDWQWVGAIDKYDQSTKGRFVWAQTRVKREKKEYEKDTPDFQIGTFDLIIQPAQPGFQPALWAKGGDGQKEVEKNWKYFDEIVSAQTRAQEEVKIGNHKGAFLKLGGSKARTGEPAALLIFMTVLKGELYVFRSFCWGHTDVYKQMAKHVGEALNGVKFLDTKEPQAGPFLTIVAPYAGKRGKGLGEEKTYHGTGYSFDKPEEFAEVPPLGSEVSMNRDFKFAFEARSEDGEAYMYVEFRQVQINIPNRPNTEPESLIEKRAQAWLAGAGQEAAVGGKPGSKLKIKKGSFGKLRGVTYSFDGHMDGVPYTEEGCVGKNKNYLIYVKIQYGGEKAEDKLKGLYKKVRKGLDLK